jgi:hypothetical protein
MVFKGKTQLIVGFDDKLCVLIKNRNYISGVSGPDNTVSEIRGGREE